MQFRNTSLGPIYIIFLFLVDGYIYIYEKKYTVNFHSQMLKTSFHIVTSLKRET